MTRSQGRSCRSSSNGERHVRRRSRRSRRVYRAQTQTDQADQTGPTGPTHSPRVAIDRSRDRISDHTLYRTLSNDQLYEQRNQVANSLQTELRNFRQSVGRIQTWIGIAQRIVRHHRQDGLPDDEIDELLDVLQEVAQQLAMPSPV